MHARRKSIPSYLPHKQSGRARAVWTDQTGTRQFRLLPGPFDSPESRAAYRTLLLELEAAPLANPAAPASGLTMAEVLLGFLEHAERHYRGPDGRPTSELRECKLVVRALRELYADKPADGFGPLSLKAVRQVWLNAGLARSEANRRTNLVRRIFKWAASEELVSAAVFQALQTVGGLAKGRTAARETEPIGPVEDAVVDATLPYLNRHARGLVEFQRLTGCRPGEACLVRRADIDTGGAVWWFKPARHKTAHRGKPRAIPGGPKAQALLRRYFAPDVGDYLFSPRRAVEEFHSARSADRATPRYASRMKRNAGKRVKNPRRRPAERYTAASYGHAVGRVCDRAFPPPAPLAQREGETRAQWWGRLTAAQRSAVKAWRAAHRWHPNKLRHAFATRVRKQHGLEAAHVLLGHARADVTQVYAERDTELGAVVAAKIG
jgi:integrase